ncbi:hypothetical protein FDH34_gp445 [Serratia phage BF]|uniref:Uncharacterized protein n=1 Tax=Serratia phage BF TaxID=1962671 RepID=A0A1S6UB90_9CAUD|nr:hypothetical protein FDH34_gp445 [Serratia phage BF]AQW89000.1 hypothetical protein BF_0475 [Serratia phage BF]QXO12168.1 hypothetical protein pEaSNUABM44_00501 [Erwinia phage pEa_SNUABM_44]QXO12724.1 hypothetical protein pEaSNUABM49_00505 [Erwinia phage pEa_SNUABM_49]
MNILIICTTIMFISALIALMVNRSIAARIYERTILDLAQSDLPDSPYGVSREPRGDGSWGYCITKNGKIVFSSDTAQIFPSIGTIINEINKLEKIEGYKLTRV